MIHSHLEGRTCAAASQPNEHCEFESLGAFADKSGKVGSVSVLRCTRCGIGITMPPLPDVAFLYDGRESQDFQPGTRGLAHHIKNIAFRIQARRLLRRIAPTPMRILDFGCGSGQFTRCIGEEAKSATIVGSDFHSDAPIELEHKSYFSLADALQHEGTFDLVLAMHVLEHDDDVPALLRRITAMAKPGGNVILEVPNIDCFWAGILGQAWDAWYLPYHRTHFTRRALRAAITEAGLIITDDINVCVPTMGRSIASAFGAPNNLFYLLAGVALHPLQWLGEKMSGRPSAIRIIATRPYAKQK